MTDEQTLVKTLDFQLDIQSDNESLLYDATLESRSVYNETIRLAKEGVDWDAVPDRVADDANLVKNTTRCVVFFTRLVSSATRLGIASQSTPCLARRMVSLYTERDSRQTSRSMLSLSLWM